MAACLERDSPPGDSGRDSHPILVRALRCDGPARLLTVWFEKVARVRLRDQVPPRAACDRVGRVVIAGQDHVVAGARDEAVPPGPAVEGVVASEPLDTVRSRARDERIVSVRPNHTRTDARP